MDAIPISSTPVKIAMIVVGLAFGALDVKESGEKLDAAMRERSVRAIGAQMLIADPFFVTKAWLDQVSACRLSFWCYRPPPSPEALPRAANVHDCLASSGQSLTRLMDTSKAAPPFASQSYRDCMAGRGAQLDTRARQTPSTPSPSVWWRSVGPVHVARMAVFPVFQAGWTLFNRGWTARVVFFLSFLAAFALAASAGGAAESVPGAVVGAVVCFLVVSIVVSFGFNLLLRAGNVVAGYRGVLVAIASGSYFTLELVGRARELLHASGIGGTRGH
ncbi:MAG: hypothetical protein IPF98_24650 [Gemmatimonadetes bacterium]|nr:hypothetical protein [Gemmatimonadota bacterium]MCC6772274.1 hypothetical protein [Gemmatimonadaceae bacterium]